MEKIIEVKDLNISYKTGQGLKPVVKDISFSLYEKEILAMVGGSGCGKTTTCKALAELLGEEALISGDIGKNVKGNIAFIFQDPYLSLDPSQAVGKQIADTIEVHFDRYDAGVADNKKAFIHQKSVELLGLVGIDDAEERYNDIPMYFSGGMRQRIAIAIALAMEPEVIIADELTSALDNETGEQIIALLNDLRDRLGTTIIIVTHDLGIVEDHCDRVLIMEEGGIVEEGSSKQIFNEPEESYTKNLIRYAGYRKGTGHTHGDLHFHNGKPHSHEHKEDEDAMPVHTHEKVSTDLIKDGRLGHVPHSIEIKSLSKSYSIGRHHKVEVLKDISFNIHKGELLGLAGKSGIGKTTLAKCIAGLEQPDNGKIIIDTELKARNTIQMIFQDSKSALNPRMTVRESILEAIRLNKSIKSRELEMTKLQELLDMTELDQTLLPKRPYEISGGQRQRVAIARALALNPKFIIADEPISSLDVAAQAQMVHLIKKIQKENDLTVLLISHDVPMLTHVCDRIIRLPK